MRQPYTTGFVDMTYDWEEAVRMPRETGFWPWLLRPLCWLGLHKRRLWDEYTRYGVLDGPMVHTAYFCVRCGVMLDEARRRAV